jgi:purine catabolism regulator
MAMREEGSPEALLVRELVRESGLGLSALTGEVGLDRAIKGIHYSELRDPAPWMAGESVLITMGQVFAADVDAGLWLLDRLATIETAALAIATGHRIERIPFEMIEHARRLKMPLLEIPFGVPMRTVVAYVYDALASSDLHRLRRTVATQNHLLDLLAADSGVDDLIASVAGLLEMPIVLFDGRGRILTSARATDLPRLSQRLWRSWPSSSKAGGPMGLVEAGQARFYYRDIVLYGKVERVIAASSPQAASSEFIDTSLSFLQRLVTLDLLKRRDELVARQRMRQTLLRDFLTGAAAAEELTEWVAEQGIDLTSPWRVVVCEVSKTAAARTRRTHEVEDALIEAVDSFLGTRGLPFLSRPRRTAIVVLLPDGPQPAGDLRGLLGELQVFAAGEPYRLDIAIGCSAAHDEPRAGSKALQEARDAASAAAQGFGAGGLVRFEEMSGRFRLLSGQSEDALADIARRTIMPLIESDAKRHTYLLATLRTLFDNGLAVQPTAEALFIHRNSLQKRLRRIEGLLGVDLSDLDDVMELYLGLRATELLGETTIAQLTRH